MGLVRKKGKDLGKSERATNNRFKFDPKAKPIWDVIQDIVKQIPPEEAEKLPHDLSLRHDYYKQGKTS